MSLALWKKYPNARYWIVTALGFLLLLPYLYAWSLGDLRQRTAQFEIAFFAAFALYTVAVILILRDERPLPTRWLVVIFAFAIAFRAILVLTPPRLSDDMFRYVWDGRVQAHGINPYAYPPSAPQLVSLRDYDIYPLINRKPTVTVYPAGAELAYAVLWRIVPDNPTWFQIAMATGDLAAGGLLVLLLRALGRPTSRALIYLWSPLVIFEMAHAAHIDGLVLPLLVGAWLARTPTPAPSPVVWGRDGDASGVGVAGGLLGAAMALKLYPVILFPALWRVENESWKRAWIMPLAMSAALVLPYLFYLSQGAGVLGFLSGYFDERFNMGLAGVITFILERTTSVKPQAIVNALLALVLAIISLYFIVRPARNAQAAIRRCIFPIGAFILLTQNLFPWYVLWLVPLVALFLQPGRLGLRFDAWTGWFLFTGLIALAYTFFIRWTPMEWALWAQFVPLYFFLITPALLERLRAFGLAVGNRANKSAKPTFVG